MSESTTTERRKVHVTLHRHDCLSVDAVDSVARRLVNDYGLSELNVNRVRFFGVASGFMNDDDIDRLRSSGLVCGVDHDRVRSL